MLCEGTCMLKLFKGPIFIFLSGGATHKSGYKRTSPAVLVHGLHRHPGPTLIRPCLILSDIF